MDDYRIRRATPADTDSIERLLPRLADFPATPRLKPEDVWRYDAKVLDEWSEGGRPETWVQVAIDEQDRVVGAAIGTLTTDSFTEQLLSLIHI